MNCQQCLAELSTGSLRELGPDSEVMRHSATCPDCGPLTTLLREREYNAANVLNNLPPISNPITVAESAVRTAHRRRVGRVAVMLTGAALAATIWIAAATTNILERVGIEDGHRGNTGSISTLRTETIPLSCLSPEQAGDIINPYIRSPRSAYYIPGSGLSAITVRGTPAELERSRVLIRDFENDPAASCRSTATVIKRLQDELSQMEKAKADRADQATKADQAMKREPAAPKK
jgi:hypothetical protein